MIAARHTLIAAALLPFVAACDPEEPSPALDDVEFRCHWTNPDCPPRNTPFTGLVVGLSLLDTNYNDHEGTRVHKLALAGGIGLVDRFWAYQGQLFAKKGTVEYSGFQLDDAVFSLTVDGTPVELKIAAVAAPAPGHAYWHYTFTYQTDDMDSEKPACVPTGANDFGAVVQRDLDVDPDTGDVTLRANTVFVACLRGALGEISYEPLGYGFRPWETGLGVFEAATDMLRANYCDDGNAWTEYGNLILQQNKYGIGNDLLNNDLDAVWGLSGAICLGATLRGGRKYEEIECDDKPPLCTDADGWATYQQEGRFITNNN